MTTDLLLAIAHHLVAFSIAALLFAELVLVRQGITAAAVGRVARLDMGFGIFAGLILVIGFLRVFLGAKPEAFYLESPYFWAKIAAFVVVGLLSIGPTRRFIAWSRQAGTDAGYQPPADEVASVRRLIHIEVAIFVLIPTFAAIMARGYGL